jgi:hypothetical protein
VSFEGVWVGEGMASRNVCSPENALHRILAFQEKAECRDEGQQLPDSPDDKSCSTPERYYRRLHRLIPLQDPGL